MKNYKLALFRLKQLNQLCIQSLPFLFLPTFLMLPSVVSGLTITEDFTGTKTSNNWLLPLVGGGNTR